MERKANGEKRKSEAEERMREGKRVCQDLPEYTSNIKIPNV